MPRRRRRHADPATLPRRAKTERPERAERPVRDSSRAELVRVHESLARAVSIMLAAVVYFGTWFVNAAVGLFPPPQGLDLTHPQFLIGVASLIGALWLTRVLVRSTSVDTLVRLGSLGAIGLGLVLAVLTALFLAAGAPPEGLAVVVLGLGLSWLVAALWIALLARRAAGLQARILAGN